jgi:hypothetical protein
MSQQGRYIRRIRVWAKAGNGKAAHGTATEKGLRSCAMWVSLDLSSSFEVDHAAFCRSVIAQNWIQSFNRFA